MQSNSESSGQNYFAAERIRTTKKVYLAMIELRTKCMRKKHIL